MSTRISRPLTGGRRKVWAGDMLHDLVLERHSFVGESTPCRVCGRALLVGDHVVARTWLVGFSCVTCGWFTLEDLESEPAWRAAFGGSTMLDVHARQLRAWRLVELDDVSKRMTWTDVGTRLRDERRKARGAA